MPKSVFNKQAHPAPQFPIRGEKELKMKNETNILSVDEIISRMRYAGRKKTKQLMNKLLKRIGARHRCDRIKSHSEFELRDISGFQHEEFVYSMFGYDFYSHTEEIIDTVSGKPVDEQSRVIIKHAMCMLRVNSGY
jgi:hypothetical protein